MAENAGFLVVARMRNRDRVRSPRRGFVARGAVCATVVPAVRGTGAARVALRAVFVVSRRHRVRDIRIMPTRTCDDEHSRGPAAATNEKDGPWHSLPLLRHHTQTSGWPRWPSRAHFHSGAVEPRGLFRRTLTIFRRPPIDGGRVADPTRLTGASHAARGRSPAARRGLVERNCTASLDQSWRLTELFSTGTAERGGTRTASEWSDSPPRQRAAGAPYFEAKRKIHPEL